MATTAAPHSENSTLDSSNYPPGTVLLEDIIEQQCTTLLQPQPSDDPNDPLNWRQHRKTINFLLAGTYSMLTTALLNLSPVLYQDYNDQLGISFANLNNAYAANCAGLAVGCLLFIPFALKYGRRPVYIVSLFITFLTAIWQALVRDYPSMVGSQVVSGLSGAVCDVIVQMTVADIFFLHERGTMNAAFFLFFSSGATFGPMLAGVIADQKGWPWVYWSIAILTGILLLGFIFGYEETKYSAVIDGVVPGSAQDAAVADKADLDPEATHFEGVHGGRQAVGSPRILNRNIPRKTYWQRLALATVTPGSLGDFLRHTYRPLIILCSFPAVAFTALQYGGMLSWFSVVVNTQSELFSSPPYNFNPTQIGLLSLAPFIGYVLAAVWSGLMSDWSVKRLAKRNGGVYEPEMRLYLCIGPIICMPVGIWIYGYTTARGDSWIIPCVGTAFFAFGCSSICTLSLSYVIDCYREVVGDALVGVTFFRNALSAGIVFAITPWIESIGFTNTITSVGCLALAILLTTVPIIIWGKKWRMQSAETYAYYSRL